MHLESDAAAFAHIKYRRVLTPQDYVKRAAKRFSLVYDALSAFGPLITEAAALSGPVDPPNGGHQAPPSAEDLPVTVLPSDWLCASLIRDHPKLAAYFESESLENIVSWVRGRAHKT